MFRHILSIIAVMIIALPSFAQDKLVPKEQKDLKADGEVKLGWTPQFELGANISFGSSKDVVGQTNGDTKTLGLNVKGAYNYKNTKEEWRNSLAITEAASTSPTIPRYVKSADDAKLETIYLRSLENYPKIGPYAKASAQAAIFKGENVQEREKTYKIKGAAGDLHVGDSYRLTESFKPLTTKESVGFFAKIIDRKKTKFEVRAGIGAMQVDADGQLAVDDDSSTESIIELKELKSFDQAGIEVGLTWEGQWDAKSSYSVGIEALTPLANDVEKGEEDDPIKLTNIDGVAKITSKIYEWANVSYEFKAKQQPQLVDKWQLQHLLVVNFTHTIF